YSSTSDTDTAISNSRLPRRETSSNDAPCRDLTAATSTLVSSTTRGTRHGSTGSTIDQNVASLFDQRGLQRQRRRHRRAVRREVEGAALGVHEVRGHAPWPVVRRGELQAVVRGDAVELKRPWPAEIVERHGDRLFLQRLSP